jgi:DNA adenine methylase
VPEAARARSRNLWVLVHSRPINLGLVLQPPAEATYWTLEGDTCWHPMPAGWATIPTSTHRPTPTPGQGTLPFTAALEQSKPAASLLAHPVPAPAAEPEAPPSPVHRTPRRGNRREKHHPAPGQGTLWQGDDGPAKPLLRWPGGKTYLLGQLRQLLSGFPCDQYHYLEAMVGGGAAFWEFGPRFRTRTISDLNQNLVNLYRVVQTDVERLIAELRTGEYSYQGKSDRASLARFRRLLGLEPADPILRAAQYLYINKTCWGGMMRTVRGKLKASPNPSGVSPSAICDARRLRACSAALRGATILQGSAHEVIAQARAAHPDSKVLLFVDPPYHDPAKKFVEYSGEFTRRDQAELALEVIESGYNFIYTNKATDYILSLFAGARGVERITLPLRHKLGSGRVETELLVHNLI